jgi:methionyl aminopeptidase
VIYLRRPEEVEAIRKSARLTAACLDHLERLVQPGVTPRQLDRAAEEFVRAHGAVPAFLGYYEYPATLCVSVNETVVHGIPTDLPLVEGDIVGLDMGVVLDGWYSDSARTLPVGAASDESSRLLAVTHEALLRGIAQAVEGNRVGDIGNAVQSYVEGFGFSVVRDLFGHGVGRQLHEEPKIPNYGRPGRGVKLMSGMVVAIEPMVNLGGPEVYTLPDRWTVVTRDRTWSAHFEHTVAIHKDRAEILTVAGEEARTAAGAPAATPEGR